LFINIKESKEEKGGIKMKKNFVVSLATGLFMLGMISMAQAAPVITSTFESDSDGWMVTDFYNLETQINPSWSGTGGLPDGTIYTFDVVQGTLFSAPSKFLGNKIDYIGGTFSFDMKNSVADYNGGETYYNLYFLGSDMLITHRGTYPTVPNQWVYDDVALVFQDWTYAIDDWTTPVTVDDFSIILGNLEGVYITTDWGWGPDTGWLDNVVLQATPISDVDNDNDGYTENEGDCNDENAAIYPGATEIADDGIDQDCNGSDLITNTCFPACFISTLW
jgi:hypothetical protein